MHRPGAAARSHALQLGILGVGMGHTADAGARGTGPAGADVTVVLLELPGRELAADFPLAALAAQSVGHVEYL